MSNPRILVVDDDVKIVKLIKLNLQARGYEVHIAYSGIKALELVEEISPDLIVLDLLMPDLDGREVCRQIRQVSDALVLILSAFTKVQTKVDCLELGADDYLVKPFSVDELIARIEALLKRYLKHTENDLDFSLLTIGELVVDLSHTHVSISGHRIRFTATEYKILQTLGRNAGKVVTHEYLLGNIWGPQYQNETEYLRVYISRIRKKLARYSPGANYIETIQGIGYHLGSS